LLISYTTSKITKLVDEPRVEITLTTLVAYGSYLAAEHLHVSGVIATVVAGLVIGNYGAHDGMSPRTRVAVWSFWEYAAFLVNSLVFLLVGIEVHVAEMLSSWSIILIATASVVLARALVVYGLAPLSNRLGEPIPANWNPVMVWGGLHGSVSIALVLSLPQNFEHRSTLLTLCFGVCAFSMVVQGLTMKPLLARLGLLKEYDQDYAHLKARQFALGAARLELEQLGRQRAVSPATLEKLTSDLDQRAQQLESSLASLQQAKPELVAEELRLARLRLLAAERAAVQRAAIQGFVSTEVSERILAESADELDQLGRTH
jgi:CPA1 family monovalent cation:H+ antiporter